MLYNNRQCYDIIGAAMQVYNTLGYGFLEAVYQEALSIEFSRRGIPFSSQQKLWIYYAGIELQQTFKPDFICFDQIILEIKAVSALANPHRAQLLNYLRSTGYKLGLLINFGNPKQLEFERKIFWQCVLRVKKPYPGFWRLIYLMPIFLPNPLLFLTRISTNLFSLMFYNSTTLTLACAKLRITPNAFRYSPHSCNS